MSQSTASRFLVARWPRIPGSLLAVVAGVFLFDPDFARGWQLAVLYTFLPFAVLAIEWAGAMPQRARPAGLEFALGAWILVLVLWTGAFVRFGIVHGAAAVAITIVLADIASSTLAVRQRCRLPEKNSPARSDAMSTRRHPVTPGLVGSKNS